MKGQKGGRGDKVTCVLHRSTPATIPPLSTFIKSVSVTMKPEVSLSTQVIPGVTPIKHALYWISIKNSLEDQCLELIELSSIIKVSLGFLLLTRCLV